MSKARAACKPAKLAGSGRKLVSAFQGTNSIEDNECMKASKEICLGLRVFHATFGFDDDNQESLFHGFSPHEIRLASDTSKIRRRQVENEHKARGFVYIPPFDCVRPSPKASPGFNEPQNNTNTSSSQLEIKNSKSLSRISSVEPVKKSASFKKTKKLSEKGDSQVGFDDQSKNSRKFVLPIRSAHSSRIIKPNKRFQDIDDDELSCDGSESSASKKMRFTFENFSDDSSSSWAGKKGAMSDVESTETGGGWSSSVSTASSSVKDDDLTGSVLPGRVILRKAKLKVDSNLPSVSGTFSSGNKSSQKVVCGVCGAVRFYKYLAQARKFGVYSCESCRKFISRVIQRQYTQITCSVGKGNCVIPPYVNGPQSNSLSHSRCRACWLKMCLHCYCMPHDLAQRLRKMLPSFMRQPTNDTDEESEAKDSSKVRIRAQSHKYASSLATSKMSQLKQKLMEKQIQIAKNLRKKAEALARREISVGPHEPETKEAEGGDDTAPLRVKRRYVKKALNSASEMGMKRKRSKKDPSLKDDKTQKLNLKGPRVKHVCRSASLVLGQPVATFTDCSPSKSSCVAVEDDNLTRSTSNNNESEDVDGVVKKEQVPKCKLTNETENELLPSGKMKCKPSLVEHNPDPLLDGRARTLQDLTRQHYELVNGATLDERHSGLVSLDFWESYDPELVCKTGFALVGYLDSFNTKPICFICGCSGMDKMIHCACCCEPFHHYCVEGLGQGVVEGDWWRIDWVCTRCTLCRTCGRGGGAQVACQRCRKSYHTECLVADRVASRLHSADRPWVCQACLCCKSCSAAEVYKFVGNLPLCRNCFKLRQRGNFCPLCQSCYDDNDFDTKMMECERCKCWVHAKCEGLSNEKYHILSILPDSVEFVCRLCCKSPPAPWWLAVETELKAGLMAVLKSLSKNRKACELLKWSPVKRPSACLCSNRLAKESLRFPELSEQSDAESADVKLIKEECPSGEDELRKRLQSDGDESLVEAEKCSKNKYGAGDSAAERKGEDLQLKLDSDAISYQTTDEKPPPQLSPHATSQSDSGIGSTDDELKSTNDQCFCLETWNKNPLTLLTVKKKVVSNEYSSLDSFNKEMEEMINSMQGDELIKVYHQTMEEVFPWFDPLCSGVFESATRLNNIVEPSNPQARPNGKEPLKKQEIDDIKVTLKGQLNLNNEYYYNIDKLVDERMCVFCRSIGEGQTTLEGRLLYCGHGDWAHSNCALWSNEVFEEIDGALQNVQSAISRSRHIRCSHCMKKGASVGCCNRSCPEAYHFTCARNSNCIFFEDKSLFCSNHRKDLKVSRLLQKDEDFLVTRPVYVELESKKKRSVLKQNIQIVIGSLMISNLGDIVPDLSDQENALVPCNFQCTRMFWSSVEPWRLVKYTIRTKIVYTVSDSEMDNEHNYTIDHSVNKPVTKREKIAVPVKTHFECDEDEVKEVVEFVVESVCSKEDEDPQASTDLLPPELKEAIFDDLSHDLFDGISMQDIFPKLMNFDSCTLDSKPDKDSKTNHSLNSKKRKPSVDHLFNSSVKGCETKHSNSKLSLSLKKKNKVSSEDVKKVDIIDEKENTDQRFWLSKIVQIDGAGDCSSDSSDFSSSETESTTILSPVENTRSCKLTRVSFKEFEKSKTMVPTLLTDESVSCSSSVCNSPERDSWKLGQLDGTMDFCLKDNEDLEENPVKCSQCHRTYRTAQSFDRHLQTCSTDYILSCSESDSSEEDKISNSETKLTDADDVDSKTFPAVDDEPEFVESLPDEKLVDEKENAISDYHPLTFESNSIDERSNSDFQNQSIEEATDFSSHFSLQSTTNISSNIQTEQNQQNFISRPKTIRAMIETNETQSFEIPLCGRTSPIKIRPVKTYSRKKKVMTTSIIETPQPGALIEYQSTSQSNAPALIIQSMPQSTLVPSYSCVTQQASQFSCAQSLPYIKPQIPLAIQIQPPISLQPVIPTVLGTLIQPNGMEQYVVNTPSVEVQPSNVYITNVNQPMYVNMETVVSNTVMSSSQFMNGMSYSATTTQMFQTTAKPMIDLPQSYVVVNTSNNQTQIPQQTLYTNSTQQPWTLNYQVKEKTTYQQVTRHLIKEERNYNCVKMGNTGQEAFIIEKPIIKEVTVEKTHSVQKTGVPSLPQLSYSINPPLENSCVKSEMRPTEKAIVRTSSTQQSTQMLESNVVNKMSSLQSKPNYENTLFVNREMESKKNESVEKSKDSVCLSFTEHSVSPSMPIVISPVKPVITKVKSKLKLKTNSTLEPAKPKMISELLKLSDKVKVESEEVKTKPPVVNKPLVENKTKPVTKTNVELTKPRAPLKENKALQNRTKTHNSKSKKSTSSHNLCNPKLVYEVSSQDGISICSHDLTEAWKKIFDAVQSAREAKRLPPLPGNPAFSHLRMLGLDNNSVKYLIEQLPGAMNCTNYKPTYHKNRLFGHSEPLRENPTGCARTEAYSNERRKYDMFSWLASRHRRPPKLIVNSESEIVNGISRRATSSNLPMAMRFRHLKETSKEAVGVFRSDIHGRGLFCLRDIEAGEMVIEYAGEVIRAGLTDMRENYYTSKGIGCYMFRIDDHFVVDATMHGNAARFINHSCEPNCYSRVVDILGKKHILIFAHRKIPQGEELTYDYKFPLEEDKITCHCLSRKCRKYLN